MGTQILLKYTKKLETTALEALTPPPKFQQKHQSSSKFKSKAGIIHVTVPEIVIMSHPGEYERKRSGHD